MASHVYKIAYRSTLADAVQIVNTWHIENETDVGAQTSLQAFDTAQRTDYRALLPTTATLIDATAVEVPLDSTPIPTPDVGYIAIGQAGTRSIGDVDLSPALTCVAQLKTGVAGRRARGRCWLPPAMDSGEVASGSTWQNTSTDWFYKCNTFINSLVTTSYSDGVQLVVYSKVAAALNAANVWFHVLSYVLPNKAHWIRSRDLPGP